MLDGSRPQLGPPLGPARDAKDRSNVDDSLHEAIQFNFNAGACGSL